MTEEQKQVYQTMLQDARKYVHNIMDLPGMYDPEGFENIIKEQQEKRDELFKRFSDEDMLINKEHLIQGYCTFGTEFLKNVVEKDNDSALNMFEVIMQEYLDLKLAVDEVTKTLEDQALLKKNLADNSYNDKKEEN